MYGECLLKGEGVRTDFTLGIRLIREAAEWGDGPSMVHVGE
jgi:TPR repeat protein